LDMKVADVGEGNTVAFCSVLCTLRDFCTKAGGGQALVNAIQDFAEERGFSVVVGLTQKDDEGRKGITLTSRASTGKEKAIETRIRERLIGPPASIPKVFRENPLFDAQGLLEHGFELQIQDDLQPLEAFTLRGSTTRKTVMPLSVHAASAL